MKIIIIINYHIFQLLLLSLIWMGNNNFDGCCGQEQHRKNEEYVTKLKLRREGNYISPSQSSSSLSGTKQSLLSMISSNLSKTNLKITLLDDQSLKKSLQDEKSILQSKTLKLYLQHAQPQLTSFEQEECSLLNAYLGQFQDNKGQKQKNGSCIEYTIIKNQNQNNPSTTLVIFAGQYKQNKKKEGMYFYFQKKQDINSSFLFKGQFISDQRTIGIKIMLVEGGIEKYWGQFNNFQLEGKGISFTYDDTDTTDGQYYYFKGEFKKGKKDGQGVIYVIGETPSFQPRKNSNERQISYEIIDRITQSLNSQLRSYQYQKLNEYIHKIVLKATSYSPSFENIPTNEKQIKVKIQSTWINNKITGYATQIWPKQSYAYKGMYKDNVRKGYGQQFADGEMIAKGFYSEGKLCHLRDNPYLLKGWKLKENVWTSTAFQK